MNCAAASLRLRLSSGVYSRTLPQLRLQYGPRSWCSLPHLGQAFAGLRFLPMFCLIRYTVIANTFLLLFDKLLKLLL